MLITTFKFTSSRSTMENESIEWSKYNIFQRVLFWCVIHYDITIPVLLVIVTIIMVTNCIIANRMYNEEVKVLFWDVDDPVGNEGKEGEESSCHTRQG